MAIAGLLLPTLMTSARADEEPAKPVAADVADSESEAVPVEETPDLPAEIPTPATDDETPDALRRSLVTPNVAATEQDEASESDEESNIFTEWWFWAAAAAVVGGTVAVGILASQPSDKPARGCMPGYLCFGDGRE